jgi:hypothetical protein
MNELRGENARLRKETLDLEARIRSLTQDRPEPAAVAQAGSAQMAKLRTRCDELERRISGARSRIEKIVGRLKALET